MHPSQAHTKNVPTEDNNGNVNKIQINRDTIFKNTSSGGMKGT